MDYYPRKIEKKLDDWLKKRETILLKGPRQAGKTTLLLHFKDKLQSNYISLEDPEMKDALERDAKSFANRFLQEKRTVLFIDEAQYVKDIGKKLKLIYDLYGDRIKLIVTGSGSFDIKDGLGKFLVGRAVYFELLPLSFEEFLMWKAKDLHRLFRENVNQLKTFLFEGKSFDVNPVFQKEFYNLMEEYIVFGGFPAIVKEKNNEVKKELLKNLATTYIEKDAFFFLGVRQLEKFRNLMRYLSFNNGSLLNYADVSRSLQMDYSTTENYLSILQNTYLLLLIPPFFRNVTTELKKSKKHYFMDSGLRNSLVGNFLPLENRNDKGSLFENFILRELLLSFEDGKVNYWRTTGKAEVDFILQSGNKIIPVEVKSNDAKVSRSILSFINSYKPEKAIIFNLRKFGVEKMNKTKILFLPHYFI